jgi:hypothetical protein
MLRTIIIGVIIFFVARYAYRLIRPGARRQDSIRGKSRAGGKPEDHNQIEDIDFKEIKD